MKEGEHGPSQWFQSWVPQHHRVPPRNSQQPGTLVKAPSPPYCPPTEPGTDGNTAAICCTWCFFFLPALSYAWCWCHMTGWLDNCMIVAQPKAPGVAFSFFKSTFLYKNKSHHGEKMKRVVQYDQFRSSQNSIHAAVQVCGSALFLQLTWHLEHLASSLTHTHTHISNNKHRWSSLWKEQSVS